jgi:hypothetical protein
VYQGAEGDTGARGFASEMKKGARTKPVADSECRSFWVDGIIGRHKGQWRRSEGFFEGIGHEGSNMVDGFDEENEKGEEEKQQGGDLKAEGGRILWHNQAEVVREEV